MSRRPAPKAVALADQVLAVLREAEGFPMPTSEVAQAAGDHQIGQPGDSPTSYQWWCSRCGFRHDPPVWRPMRGEDVRPVLVRMLKAGLVERLVMDGYREHYWRASL